MSSHLTSPVSLPVCSGKPPRRSKLAFDAALLKDPALREEAVTLSRTAHRLAAAFRASSPTTLSSRRSRRAVHAAAEEEDQRPSFLTASTVLRRSKSATGPGTSIRVAASRTGTSAKNSRSCSSTVVPSAARTDANVASLLSAGTHTNTYVERANDDRLVPRSGGKVDASGCRC